MRVAVVGISGDGTLATALARGADQIGHEGIVIHSPALVAGRRALILARRVGRESLVARPLVRRLEAELASAEPDLVIVTKGRFLARPAIERLRRALGIPFINYYPDHPLWPGQNDPEIIDALRGYDEVAVWGARLAEKLRECGLERVRIVPFGYDPQVYRPPDKRVERRWEIAFVGQCYPNRVPYAEGLADYELLVSGIGWKEATRNGPLAGRAQNRTLPGAETCRTYWRASVALNVLAEWNVPAHNMRTFEVPATATVMVTTRTPEHHRLFGSEGAVLVSDPDEARDAVRALLADPDRLAAIGAEGRRRVKPHTYAARLGTLLRPWLAPAKTLA